ncbi:MAG: 30S ribosomal protein S11 [Coxiellaceae bacterium]|nr:30S ribosomal protein S11 [Coxiellaceae bacterium]
MATKQRTKQRFSEGVATIKATFNNTLITISTPSGDVLCQASAGRAGFKNSRKGTPYAAQLAAETAAKEAREKYDMKRIAIRVKGPGAGRDSAIRAINAAGMSVIRLEDVTPLPHNGCRPRKKRRV